MRHCALPESELKIRGKFKEIVGSYNILRHPVYSPNDFFPDVVNWQMMCPRHYFIDCVRNEMMVTFMKTIWSPDS